MALHEVLGFPDVLVYDGGWWEYSHLVGVPVQQEADEAGPQPADRPPPGASRL